MATSGVIYNILHWLSLPVDIRNICVLLAPGFSALTAWSMYMFTKEMKDESGRMSKVRVCPIRSRDEMNECWQRWKVCPS